MRPIKTILLLLLVNSVVVLASHAQQARETFLTGIGFTSCAHWLSSRSREGEGNAWISGYWSGLNYFNPKTHSVGKSITDNEAIYGEVKKVCQLNPSTPLSDAALNVYVRFQESNK